MIVTVNGEAIDVSRYSAFHRVRIRRTIDALKAAHAKRVIEIGGHPWAFTSALLDEPDLKLVATVSAEEVCQWPDAFAPTRRDYSLTSSRGQTHRFPNYSANIERSLIDVAEPADAVIACEIIEHLLRAPHVMLLNANRWLPIGGKLLITTPNGAQFSNPLRIKSASPGYRAHVYERHNHLYTLDLLTDLVECCGFRVRRAEYWDPYARTGPSRAYGLLARLPGRYFEAKFRRTLFVLAEKSEAVDAATRQPRVLVGGGWEHVRADAMQPAADVENDLP